MDSKLKFFYKKVLPFRERESYFSLCVRDFGKGENDILIGEYGRLIGEYGRLIVEYGGLIGEYDGLIGEYDGLIGEYHALIGEYHALIGEYDILQLRMLIFSLFLRFLLFRMNFEVKISFTF
jgi:hypothetical protein